MKTIKHFLLTLAVLLCSISASAHDFEVNGVYYIITSDKDKAVAVTYRGDYSSSYSNEYTGSVTIPESVIYNDMTYKVKYIGPSAFEGCSNLTSITVPSSVREIWGNAFEGCTGLTEVLISDIAAWHDISFYNDTSNPLYYAHHLYLYTAFPEHAVDLGLPSGTLWADRNIGADSSEDYGDYFAWGETEPKSSYNWSTYKWCNGEYGTFTKYCTDSSLGAVDNIKSLESMDDAAVVNWGDTWSMPTYEQLLELKSNCTWTWITQDNVNGYKVTGPNGKSIFLPAAGRRSETSLDYAGSIGYYWSNSLCEDYPTNSAWLLGFGSENLFFDYGRSSGYPVRAVTSSGKEEVKDLVIPSSVTRIDDAFQNCTGLTSVTIPNSVTSIGAWAFQNCTGLTSVTIPNSVTSIRDGAFQNCTGLASVTIGDSVTDFGYRVFDNTLWYENQPDGVIYINNILYGYKGDMPDNTSIVIKDGTTCIADSAFSDCDGLISVTIPNSVTSIGDYAFQNCTGLTSISIPSSVVSIGNSIFEACSGLKTVEFNCMNIPSAHKLGLYYPNNNIETVIIGDSVINIREQAFQSSGSLTSLTIGCNVVNIGRAAFADCQGLTELIIPNSVENIEELAFLGCQGLTSVTIGNSVKSIGTQAFSYCRNLTDVYCLAASVPETYSNAFEDSNFGNATLHVPAESVEAYAAAEPWSGFGEIVALPAEEVEITIGTTGATTFCSEYALDFTDAEGVKAYAATGYNTETGVVTLTRVKTAKAGTGLFVVGDEGTYSIPTIESSADNSLNMLVGTTEEVTIPTADGTYTNYIYGKSDDNTGFFKLTGDKVIPAGKAYLQIPTEWFPAVAESKIKIEFEDGTTTGIEDVEEQVRPNDGVIYDLHGRVVKNPGKGIYIVNGKKVLF